MQAAYAISLDKTRDPLANLELGERPTPAPGPGQALVDVQSVSLNHHDLWTLKGVVGAPVTLPRILGCEASGIVTAYGPDAPEGVPPIGSAVVLYPIVTCGKCLACLGGAPLFCRKFGMLSDIIDGSFAEHVVLPAQNVFPRPAYLSSAEAACLGVTFLTAYRMLFTRASLRPGDSVLVQGAAGGLTSAAIQLAHAAGVTVFTTSRDSAKREFAQRLGADHVLESSPAAAKQVLALTNGLGVDAVIESVGEPTWKESMRAVRPGGSIIVAGATGGPNPPADLNRVFWRQLSIIGSTMGTRAEFQTLLRFLAQAHIHPAIDRAYPLSALPQAFAQMQSGSLFGKIVINVQA